LIFPPAPAPDGLGWHFIGGAATATLSGSTWNKIKVSVFCTGKSSMSLNVFDVDDLLKQMGYALLATEFVANDKSGTRRLKIIAHFP
jgi:hypothetical protein